MIINNTIMLPIFQYILAQIDRSQPLEAIERLRDYKTDETVSIEAGGIFDSKKLYKKVNLIIDYTVEIIEKSSVDLEAAKERLQECAGTCKICGECVSCQGCLAEFWKELHRTLFDEEMDGESKAEDYYALRPLPGYLASHVEAKISVSDYYMARYREFRKVFNLKDKLVILKGMSSSTPAVLNSAFDTTAYDGGGFYLNWQGKGIAIDPGYHFIEAMHANKISILDIDCVIITHEHIDHTNDMRLLDDLHYSLYRHKEGNAAHRITWIVDKVTYGIISVLRDNKSGFDIQKNDVWYCDFVDGLFHGEIYEERMKKAVGQSKPLSEGFPLLEDDAHNGICIYGFQTYHIKKAGIKDKNRKEEFKKENYRAHTFGCLIECQKESEGRRIAYTSDTRWFRELKGYIYDADIVIANISSIYEDDVMGAGFKETHLGFHGCRKLLEGNRKTKLFLLSEFWNGKSDIRMDVAKELQVSLKEGIVLPAEVGLVVDMKHMKVRCSRCGNYCHSLHVLKPLTANGKIEYICPECMIGI